MITTAHWMLLTKSEDLPDVYVPEERKKGSCIVRRIGNADEIEVQIVEFLKSRSGVTTVELAKHTGIERRRLCSYTDILEEKGKIRTWYAAPVNGGKITRLKHYGIAAHGR